MKKLLLSTLAIGYLFAATPNANNNTNTDALLKKLTKEVQKLNKEIKRLKKQVKKNKKKIKKTEKKLIKTKVKLNPLLTNSHLYFSYSLRTSADFIGYKLNTGEKYYNNIFSNKVTLTGVSRPSDNLKATVQIEANNIFGASEQSKYSTVDNQPFLANETPTSNTVRIKAAFFNYTFDDNKFMFSAGRRPSTEGFPLNLIYGDNPNSPLAHVINMEFDGFSFGIEREAFASLSPTLAKWGTWMKICAGRGYSSSKGKYPNDGSPSYTKDNLKITDFAGFLLVPYDDGQYSFWMQNVWSWGVKGYNMQTGQLEDTGTYYAMDLNLRAQGIGDGSNMFLYNTTAFIDFAYTKTSPYAGKKIQGSPDKKEGWSIWVGAQMPGFTNNDTWGFNFVHGSKYFRPMTYGEDTLVGSIAAVRGNAYDIYYNHQIIPHLKFGLRGTLLNYQHSGSEGFFGDYSDPNLPVYVKKAYDIKAYIKYSF